MTSRTQSPPPQKSAVIPLTILALTVLTCAWLVLARTSLQPKGWNPLTQELLAGPRGQEPSGAEVIENWKADHGHYRIENPRQFIQNENIDWNRVANEIDVVTFGQNHDDQESYAFIAQALPSMKAAGFGRLFLELSPIELYPGKPLEEVRNESSRYLVSERQRGIMEILASALAVGITTSGFDLFHDQEAVQANVSNNSLPNAMGYFRNKGMAQFIRDSADEYPPTKFITFNGMAHLGRGSAAQPQTLNDYLAHIGYRSLIIKLSPQEETSQNRYIATLSDDNWSDITIHYPAKLTP